jgi:L-iditol 2-dehydrogenase
LRPCCHRFTYTDRLKMLAAIQSGLDKVDIRDISAPADEDAALVRVRAAGICGSDLDVYHHRAEAQSVPGGHEVAGEVVQLPTGYDGPVRVGDLVAVDSVCLGLACGACAFCRSGQPFHCPERNRKPAWGGGFAEFIRRYPAGLFPLPAVMTAEQGALVEPLAVGVHSLRWARMTRGSTVVIVGAGTIGLMTLIAARALGAANVHVLARHPHQAELARMLGADTLLPAAGADAVTLTRDLTGGVGADLVVEAVGRDAGALQLAWQLVRPQGTVSVVGVFSEQVTLDLIPPLVKEVWTTFPVCYSVIEGRHDYELAIEILATNHAPATDLVTHRFPLQEAAEAFRTAADKSTGSVKVQIIP